MVLLFSDRNPTSPVRISWTHWKTYLTGLVSSVINRLVNSYIFHEHALDMSYNHLLQTLKYFRLGAIGLNASRD